MTEFDFDAHRTKGNADAARSWIESSLLPEDQKADLLQFVAKFPKLTFVKEDEAILDHYAQRDGVTLPAWLREVRSTLAFVESPPLFRVDDFQSYHSPRSDEAQDIWYELRFGYHSQEEQQLLRADAGVYRIGSSFNVDEAYLGVDLQNPADQRIWDFSVADLRDNKLAGRPVRGSLYPIFDSYAQLLSHIVKFRRHPR